MRELSLVESIDYSSFEPDERNPAQNLIIYIILDGIQKAFRGDPEDLRWLFSSDSSPQSFLWWCSLINLEGQKVQATLKENWEKINPNEFIISRLVKQ